MSIRVIEISQTKLQKLGFDFSRVFSGPVQAESLVKVVDALCEAGVASVVSHPTAVTLNSQAASIRIGGHARVAVGTGGGRVSIEDKFYGTRVDFTPVVSTNKKIHLKLRIELSHPDEAHPLTIAGETAPMLDSTVVGGAVEAKSGETVVLGGLISRDDSSKSAELGGTAGTAEMARGNPPARIAGDCTETLFMVTPEIVSPTTSKTAAKAQTRR